MTNATPSIKDVAARAGVSVGTVSNVLNRPELVSEQTRARVHTAITALGFVRHESARHLRAGRSRTLAYVALDTTNPFFTDVARGVEEVAQAAGVAVFLCDSDEDAEREARYLDLLSEQRVQGVLVTPVDPYGDRLTELPRRGTPVVLVDHRGDPPDAFCSVTVDDVTGGELATSHLLDVGHERIALVGGPLTISQIQHRRDGVLRALRRAGHGDDAMVVLETDVPTTAAGQRAAERLLALPAADRPTAVFCGNDVLALGLLRELTHRGVRVPDDLAVVGYDDIDFAAAAVVPLTSVRQPRHLLGRTAAELLLDEAAREPDHVHRQVVFQPELVVRASTTGRATAP